jgi:calcium-dependent protein kinase
VFESIDVDGNGKIFWNEFLAATISQSIYLKEENLREAFNRIDSHKKGYFDLNDLAEFLNDPDLNVNKTDIDLIFEEAFPQGKSRIYYEDFKNMMQHLHSIL